MTRLNDMTEPMRRHQAMLDDWSAKGHPPAPCSGHSHAQPNCPAPVVHDLERRREKRADSSTLDGATVLRQGDHVMLLFNREIGNTVKRMADYFKEHYPGIKFTFVEDCTGAVVYRGAGEVTDGENGG